MARIMVYKEANLVLGSSLSPNNRGICKKTAIQNNAQETPLASFAQNRLVPASVVAKKYYVVFLDEGGTPIGSGYYEPGAALNDPGVPYKAGHTGVWNNGYTGYATGDVTYSPVYTPISYTITIINDVTGTSTTESWPYGSTPSLTPPTNAGYTFAGWSPAIQPVTGDATYHATYTADIVYHTVTFISDGSTYNTQSVAHGGYATDPGSPTKSGYVFAGWSPSIASTQINGDTTFTAQFTVAVTMLADVGWKTADAGQGTPHGDPNNEYEIDSQWIPSNKIPLHIWFEPMYTSNGAELSYTDPIATVNGVNVSHNDLSWSASLGVSDNGYNYWDQSGVYNAYGVVIIMPQLLNPEQGPTNRNWRCTVQSSSSELMWMDEFPFILTGTYNGVTVVQKTMKIVCYKYSIAAAGITDSRYKGSKQGWVKNWNG